MADDGKESAKSIRGIKFPKYDGTHKFFVQCVAALWTVGTIFLENFATSFIEKGDDADPTMSELRMIIEPTKSEEAALAQGEGDNPEPEGGRYLGGLDRPDGVAERNHVAYKAHIESKIAEFCDEDTKEHTGVDLLDFVHAVRVAARQDRGVNFGGHHSSAPRTDCRRGGSTTSRSRSP